MEAAAFDFGSCYLQFSKTICVGVGILFPLLGSENGIWFGNRCFSSQVYIFCEIGSNSNFSHHIHQFSIQEEAGNIISVEVYHSVVDQVICCSQDSGIIGIGVCNNDNLSRLQGSLQLVGVFPLGTGIGNFPKGVIRQVYGDIGYIRNLQGFIEAFAAFNIFLNDDHPVRSPAFDCLFSSH